MTHPTIDIFKSRSVNQEIAVMQEVKIKIRINNLETEARPDLLIKKSFFVVYIRLVNLKARRMHIYAEISNRPSSRELDLFIELCVDIVSYNCAYHSSKVTKPTIIKGNFYCGAFFW